LTGYLLDTNVISELTRAVPHPRVVGFLNEHNDLWLSSVLLHELEYGMQLLPHGRRRDVLRTMQLNIVSAFDSYILPLDRPAAESAAELRAQARRSGRVVDVGDALIAGIARANGLTIATRNVTDYLAMDVEVTNPWEWP
jgi:predicted nucleic acid-binding protein